MSVYFCVDAPGLARRNLYLDRIEETYLARHITSIVEGFRAELPRRRPPRVIPH